MTCDFSKERLIAYFYEEEPAGERLATEQHLAACELCRAELADLRGARGVLQQAPELEVDLGLSFAKGQTVPQTGLSFWQKMGWRGAMAGLAFSLAALLILMSLANLEIRYGNGEVTLRFGLLPQSEPVAHSEPELMPATVTQAEFDAWKQESLQAIEGLVVDLAARQRRENGLVLTQLAREFDERRRYDLRQVGLGLEAFQRSNQMELQRTNEALFHILQISQQPGVWPETEPDSGKTRH